jgi:hypothetical protein
MANRSFLAAIEPQEGQTTSLPRRSTSPRVLSLRNGRSQKDVKGRLAKRYRRFSVGNFNNTHRQAAPLFHEV